MTLIELLTALLLLAIASASSTHGETLRERLESGALGWRKAAEIGASIADGLAAAFAKFRAYPTLSFPASIAPYPDLQQAESHVTALAIDFPCRLSPRPRLRIGPGRSGVLGRSRQLHRRHEGDRR